MAEELVLLILEANRDVRKIHTLIPLELANQEIFNCLQSLNLILWKLTIKGLEFLVTEELKEAEEVKVNERYKFGESWHHKKE